MTLELWNNYHINSYEEGEYINHMIRNNFNTNKHINGIIIKDDNYKYNDSKDPFINRITNMNTDSTTKPKSKVKTIKNTLVIGGLIGLGYVGYKYIYKPIKREYDNIIDRIIVKSESEKPLDGKIRRLNDFERLIYDKKYNKQTLILDKSQYKISDDDD